MGEMKAGQRSFEICARLSAMSKVEGQGRWEG